jgi:hypothetical protein
VTQTADQPICPICKAEAELLDKVGDATGYDCLQHGKFRVVDTIFAIPSKIGATRDKWEAAFKRAREREPSEWAPLIKSDDL